MIGPPTAVTSVAKPVFNRVKAPVADFIMLKAVTSPFIAVPTVVIIGMIVDRVLNATNPTATALTTSQRFGLKIDFDLPSQLLLVKQEQHY